MKFKKCIKCGISKVKNEQVFLTNDKYCTVCNHKYKDRSRIKPIFNFETIKEGEYYHLNKQGEKRTDKNIANREIALKLSSKVVQRAYIYHKIQESKKRRITEFL